MGRSKIKGEIPKWMLEEGEIVRIDEDEKYLVVFVEIYGAYIRFQSDNKEDGFYDQKIITNKMFFDGISIAVCDISKKSKIKRIIKLIKEIETVLKEKK